MKEYLSRARIDHFMKTVIDYYSDNQVILKCVREQLVLFIDEINRKIQEIEE